MLYNCDIYANNKVGVLVSTGSILVKESRIQDNGNNRPGYTGADKGAGFYSTSLTSSAITSGSEISDNLHYEN
jgi:hypothetical protein